MLSLKRALTALSIVTAPVGGVAGQEHVKNADSPPPTIHVQAPAAAPTLAKTQGFGENPAMYKGLGHGGVDFKNDCGQPVPSKSVGRVVDIGYDPDNGNTVRVRSYDGVTHLYGHTEGAPPVGTSVKRGDPLGRTNISGHTTGCHIHWATIYPDGKLRDPEKWSAEPNPCPTLFNVPADWGVTICAESAKHGADPSQVAALIWVENRGWPAFDKFVCSPAGACGIGQFMPATWSSHKQDGDGNSVPDLHSWQDNVATTAYMVGRAKKSVREMAIEYNAGPARAGRSDDQLPAETVQYIQLLSGKYQEFHL